MVFKIKDKNLKEKKKSLVSWKTWKMNLVQKGRMRVQKRDFLPNPFLAQEVQNGSLSPLEPFNCKSDP